MDDISIKERRAIVNGALSETQILCMVAEAAAGIAKSAMRLRRGMEIGTLKDIHTKITNAWPEFITEYAYMMACAGLMLNEGDHLDIEVISRQYLYRWSDTIREKDPRVEMDIYEQRQDTH